MKRSELEHVLRAAGAISGVSEWVIVGSQAILGARPDAPDEVLVSQEVDLFAPGDEQASDLIDGSIGELEELDAELVARIRPRLTTVA